MKYFKIQEFVCKCGCKQAPMNKELLERLDRARELAGIPFKINSGFRCIGHNKAVGGSKNSSHLKGIAVDIACTNDGTRWILIKALIDAGFTRIGVAKSFIHVDIDKDKNSAIWFY